MSYMGRDVMHGEVKCKEDFVHFLSALQTDLKSNPDTWNNMDLVSFLRSMTLWIEDMGEFYVDNSGKKKEITWQVFADILSIARVYE